MKSSIYLIVSFVACCATSAIAQAGKAGIYGISPYSDGNHGDTLPGYSTMHQIYEPCHKGNDEQCIRQFLASSGQCHPVHGPKDKVVYREQGIFYLPKVNFTLIQQHSYIEGLNDNFVEEFYIDKKTSNLIYAVNFNKISVPSKNAYYIFHLRGKPPIVVQDEVFIRYGKTIITAVVPIGDHGVSWKDAVITARIDELPFYRIGKKIETSHDPQIQFTMAQVAQNLDTTTPEALLTESPSFFLLYLQNFICDYGIRP